MRPSELALLVRLISLVSLVKLAHGAARGHSVKLSQKQLNGFMTIEKPIEAEALYLIYRETIEKWNGLSNAEKRRNVDNYPQEELCKDSSLRDESCWSVVNTEGYQKAGLYPNLNLKPSKCGSITVTINEIAVEQFRHQQTAFKCPVVDQTGTSTFIYVSANGVKTDGAFTFAHNDNEKIAIVRSYHPKVSRLDSSWSTKVVNTIKTIRSML